VSAGAPAADAIFGISLPVGYGRLQQTPLVVAQPAVAVGATYATKGAYRERLLCCSATLVTDANAANRSVSLSLENEDGDVLLTIPPVAVQAASLTVRYSWAVHVSQPAATIAGLQLIQIPPLVLQPGWKWVWTLGSVQAGDQLSAILGLRDQFPTGSRGYPVGTVDADDQLPGY
jgi:hypothetical protein